MADANEPSAPRAQTVAPPSEGWQVAWGLLLIIIGIVAVLMPGVAGLATALVFAWLLGGRIAGPIGQLNPSISPGYGFAAHAGYATAAHLEALRSLGPSPVHRRSFAPVRALLPAV